MVGKVFKGGGREGDKGKGEEGKGKGSCQGERKWPRGREVYLRKGRRQGEGKIGKVNGQKGRN